MDSRALRHSVSYIRIEIARQPAPWSETLSFGQCQDCQLYIKSTCGMSIALAIVSKVAKSDKRIYLVMSSLVLWYVSNTI
jgi:hypothetical protein